MEYFSMVGESEAFLQTLRWMEKFARLDAPVLIEGETGTGKELAARAIHYGGRRADGPFVPVNCGCFPDGLIESELFGHVKGAFTGAHAEHPGLIEAATAGTLFLDEVDALSLRAQVALLRFLQDGSYRSVGSRVDRKANVRVIAAANSGLGGAAARGSFRLDLLFRLRVLCLELPPLRHRDKDAMVLARAFLDRCRKAHQCEAERLDEATCAWFERYSWPGNVRELEWLIFREAMICDDRVLRLPPPSGYRSERRRGLDRRGRAGRGESYARAKAEALATFDRRYLQDLMREADGCVTTAARMAGKERRALGKLLKKYGLTSGNLGQE